MATVEKDLNKDDAGAAPAPAKKKGVMKFVLIGVAVVALIAISVGASVYLTSNLSADKEATNEKTKDGKKTAPKVVKTPIYFKFEAPFVVNFISPSNMRFLQIEMQVMTYEQEVIPVIEQAMPVIRNNLILLLSDLASDELNTHEGKLKVRVAVLAEIQKVIQERLGKPGVEEVYFTSLVMQ